MLPRLKMPQPWPKSVCENAATMPAVEAVDRKKKKKKKDGVSLQPAAGKKRTGLRP